MHFSKNLIFSECSNSSGTFHSPEHPSDWSSATLCSECVPRDGLSAVSGAPEFPTHLNWSLGFPQEWVMAIPAWHWRGCVYHHSLWACTSSIQQTSEELPVKNCHNNPGRNTSLGSGCLKMHLLAFAKGKVRLCWLRSLCPRHWVRSATNKQGEEQVWEHQLISCWQKSPQHWERLLVRAVSEGLATRERGRRWSTTLSPTAVTLVFKIMD